MKIFSSIPTDLPKTALTIGTFDGVHLGHQALFERMHSLSPHLTLLTFTNHPFQTLRPHLPIPPILTPLPLKLSLFRNYGIDVVITLPFTQEFASLSYENLLRQFPLSHLVLGEGSAFGKNREGDASAIPRYAKAHGLIAEYLPKVELDGAPISSSRIRAAIAAGDLEEAARLLGRPHCLPFPPSPHLLLALPPDGTYPVATETGRATLEVRQRRPFRLSPPPGEPITLSFDPHLNRETFYV